MKFKPLVLGAALLALTTAACGTGSASTTPAAPHTTTVFEQSGLYTVTRVIDGDTIEARDNVSNAMLTVRVIGIDTPEMDTCEGRAAAKVMITLLANHMVSLPTMGPGKPQQDKYQRALRYVDSVLEPFGSVDAGLALIQRGYAIARYDSRDGYSRHPRQDSYIAADAAVPPYICLTS